MDFRVFFAVSNCVHHILKSERISFIRDEDMGAYPYADVVRRPKFVVELFQCLSGIKIIANLDKLYAKLVQRHLPFVQTASSLDDWLSRIVSWTQSQFVLK